MVWLRTLLLQRWIFQACRDRSESTSSVVLTNTARNAIRSGVKTTVLTKRAASVCGVMSP